MLPCHNSIQINRGAALRDSLLKPFTFMPSPHWRNQNKADWWIAAKDYWKAAHTPDPSDDDDLYSQRIRLAAQMAAQSGAPVNFDHEIAGGNYTAEQVGWMASHVQIFRNAAGAKLEIGVYDVWCVGRPVPTTQEAATGAEASEKAAAKAIAAAAKLWTEVDFVCIDSYMFDTDKAGHEMTMKAHANLIRWIIKYAKKPVWTHISGRLKKVGAVEEYGGVLPPDIARQHLQTLKSAGAARVIAFGDWYDFNASYRPALAGVM